MFGIGPTELVIFLLLFVVMLFSGRIPELARRLAGFHPRARVHVEPLDTSTLLAAALLLIVVIVIAVLALATPVL